MRAEGNGDVMVCLQNLVSIVKTECPLARDKGVDARLIDQVATNFEDLDEDVTDMLAKYEPRIKVDDLTIQAEEEGRFSIRVNTSNAGGGADAD